MTKPLVVARSERNGLVGSTILVASALAVGVALLTIDFYLATIVDLTVIFTVLIALRGFYLSKIDWVRFIAELSIPAVALIFFGYGSIFAIESPEQKLNYGDFNSFDVFLVYLMALAGSLIYVAIVNTIYNSRYKSEKTFQPLSLQHQRAIFIVTAFLVTAFDLYIRYRNIRLGIYFDWFSNFSGNQDQARTGLGAFWLIIEYAPTAFLAFSLARMRLPPLLRRIFILGFLAYGLLAISSGERRDILWYAIIFTVSYLYGSRQFFTRRVILTGVAFVCAFVFVASPVIQQARLLMRRDITTLVSNGDIIQRFISTYVPEAMSNILTNNQIQDAQALNDRLGGQTAYAARVVHLVLDGHELIGFKNYLTSLQILIPRYFLPDKASLDADNAVQTHFGMPLFDANGSYLADIFAYVNVYGVILIFVILGLTIGIFSLFLSSRYGYVGALVFISLTSSYTILGDSSTGALLLLRNLLIFTLVIEAIAVFCSIILNRIGQLSPYNA